MGKKEKFQRFGKYLILDHLVDGGMAKICRARFLGEQANKLVAIKMVQPQYSKDPAFVKMFEDELKVTFGLLHPNIAQVYDYGVVDGQLYTAMEYVDGANLKQYLDRLKSKKYVFPVEVTTYIISQVCQALHYAHTFTDKMSGQELNIIHRDISPHNIMLTYDGVVKLIDFGIAKADSNSESTQAGTIKGKLSYLAPEYLDGADLDPRYDEFAVGITMWEMLCGRKLFSAPNDLAVLKQIQACKVPAPSSINPNVSSELDEIVLKALAKDREERYENMDGFNRALVKFLYSKFPDFNSTDLGHFAKQLFKDEIEAERSKFVTYGKIDIKGYLKEMKNDAPTQKSNSALPPGERTKKIELNMASNINSDGLKIEKTSLTHRAEYNKKRDDKSGTSRYERISTPAPEKNTGLTGRSLMQMAMVLASVAFVAFLYRDAIKIKTGFDINAFLGFKSPSRKVATVNPDVEALKKKEGKGIITLLGLESSMNVYLDGKEVQVDGIDLYVEKEKIFDLKVTQKGRIPFIKKGISFSSDEEAKTISIPELDKERVGLLTTSDKFTPGSRLVFYINGKKIEKNLPFENLRVPAGSYEGVIENPVLETEKKIQFNVQEDKRNYIQ